MRLKGRIVDLTHRMVPGKEEYGLSLETKNMAETHPQYPTDANVWYILQDVHISSHCGTHIEFPYHHNRNGLDAAAFPLERLVGDCALLKFRKKKPNEAVGIEELRPFADRLERGDMALFDFDCARLHGTSQAHERPYLTLDAVRWLVEEKRIGLIGSDATGIEIKGARNQPVHQYLMDRQIPIIESAANLAALRTERFLLFVLALPVVGLDSCPVRLVAIEEEAA